MLTGGVVKEEQQKAEIPQDVARRSDRLHRLIGNVLDFSRLENQRPRLEKTTVALGNLLDAIALIPRGATRCHDAGKELVLENPMEAICCSSPTFQLLHQILGNTD